MEEKTLETAEGTAIERDGRADAANGIEGATAEAPMAEASSEGEAAVASPAPVYEDVRKALLANRANTLALLGCLRETLEERPFRDAEEAVGTSRAMALTMQTPHALYAILLKCGAVESIPVPETAEAEAAGAEPKDLPVAPGTPAAEAASVALDDGTPAAEAPAHASVPGIPAPELPDQPTDYLLRTTGLGRRALDEFEPAKRFEALIAAEPAGYGDAYARVLDLCEEGAAKDAIEAALADHPALATPKSIYPGYFISKLETVDGISWDGLWRTTDAGRRMRALLA